MLLLCRGRLVAIEPSERLRGGNDDLVELVITLPGQLNALFARYQNSFLIAVQADSQSAFRDFLVSLIILLHTN